jgi:tetratricopeptide (TPR) repeat protein
VQAINQAGRLRQKGGDHEQAIELFERSQHISHRVDGVYSMDQVPALDRMTSSYLASGNLNAGNAAQNFRYNIELHQYGRGSILVVPSKVRLARFKSSIRLNDDARRLYLEAIQITENSLGENDLALVELLLGLASVRQDQRALREYRQQKMDQLQVDHSLGYYERGPPPVSFSTESAKKSPPPTRIQGTSPGQALAALIRAVQIMDLHQDEVSLANRFEIYVTLGDMYMLLRKRKSGIETYMQALQLLDMADNGEELKEQYFGRPRRLQYRKPRLLANSVGRYTNYDGTFAEASFVVLPNGMVRDVELVATNAPAPMRAMFRKEVRRSIYRPRFVDGEPVATTEHLREEFAGTVLPANAAAAGN